ncbi:MAG: class II aldolase/adducin family protein [Planctomycetota bacterium]
MSDIAKRFKKEIAELSESSKKVGDLGYASSHGGNLSYRVNENVVLITPTKVPKRCVTPKDVCVVDMAGNVIHAGEGRKPTGETPMHLGVFRARPDVNAVLHAHPPIMTGFACSPKAELLGRPVLPEPIVEIGPAVLIDYAEPLTEELARTYDRFLPTHNVFLMKNHGVTLLSREGLDRAVDFMIMLETQAPTVLVAELLGGTVELTRKDVQGLENVARTRKLPFPGAAGVVEGLAGMFFPEE